MTMLIERDIMRKWLIDWEEHHTLSRNIVEAFDYGFSEAKK